MLKYKGLILLILFAAYNIPTYAQQVDYEIAKNIATSFITIKKGDIQKTTPAISQQHTIYGNIENPLLFIFNFEEGGFVIVSADKNVDPVLAYSTTGEFLMEGKNPAAESWVNAYAQGISIAVETHATPTSEMINKWNNAEKGIFSKVQKAAVIEPLLTSKWNQDKYYNTLCPDTIQRQSMANYDDHTPNGCVAVAMAQIMYYHRYPRNGIGVSNYVCEGYGQQRADYAHANYNYEAMSDIATWYSNAIAQLCYHAGVSVRMNYKASASGAQSQDAYIAFSARFAYKASLLIHSIGSNYEGCKNLLKTNLNKRLPVYYSACTGGVGLHACHAFVCDGYDNADFFHFNWGWGGAADGWFTLSSIDFVINTEIITDIEPAREDTISTGSDTLTATYGSFSDGSPARSNYANNTNRSWLIAPQNGKSSTKITLKTAYFSTEKEKDRVTIYSGNKADADSVVAVLSGNLNETTIDVNASQCFVTFTSNESITNQGFKITYTSIKKTDNLCPSQIPSSTNCYEESQGTITNNDGDELYEDENTCYWAIKPQDYQKVGLKFTKFDLEEGDFVELYTWDGTSGLGNLKYWTHGKYRFTKQTPPVLDREYLILSVGAFVRFRTDNNLNASGFELNWYTTNTVEEAQLGIANAHIFPNPTNDVLKIQIETLMPESIQLVMNDMLGRTVYTSQSTPSEQQYRTEIDVSSFSKGVYFLRISTSKGSMTRKVVVR